MRLEAFDALETHFGETRQEPAGADEARDRLPRLLGFSNVTFFEDHPNKVKSAGQDSIRGYVLSDGIDANGRVIGFAYRGDPAEPDGTDVFLDETRVDRSAHATLPHRGPRPTLRATRPCPPRSAPT
ncbi:hypothetical protein [Streptomyces fuscichromogenes]|uniref:Uncharacterized protein n=1 Tax=Streptomyces fuscichromogenes TaxID=1324013 RepID=A0A917XL08_9ACTN|nr:hypothetical protein [Streptomyces fuscichromogenes]GGN33758.1 hypothetical protein GCM10011578_073820 [Streptomyces fuscichromogenes]